MNKKRLDQYLRLANRWIWVVPTALYRGGGMRGLWRRVRKVYRQSGWSGLRDGYEIMPRRGGGRHPLN